MNDYIKSFLSEVEIDAIITFNQNPILREAIRKVILCELYKNGTLTKGNPAHALRNFAFTLASKKGQFTNEQIGADLRALWEGINMVESGFEQLARVKKEVVKEVSVKNQAR